jgi:hypothetical protein
VRTECGKSKPIGSKALIAVLAGRQRGIGKRFDEVAMRLGRFHHLHLALHIALGQSRSAKENACEQRSEQLGKHRWGPQYNNQH